MKDKLNTDLELLKLLLWQIQAEQLVGSASDKIRDLEGVRDRLTQLLPNRSCSENQRLALELLRHQACMDFFCRRRCQAIRQSDLDQSQKQLLLDELKARFERAQERFRRQWPELDDREAAALPLLLMRQSIEQEIEQQLTRLRREQYFPVIA
ncbi:MAG: hypothetical protein ACAI44_39760 [Candidatus Sericytochromatia bacterium]